MTLTLAPTGVGATLVPTGGGRITASRRYRKRSKLETSAAVNDIGYGRTSSTICTEVTLGQVKNDVTGVKKVKIAALQNKGVFFVNNF